MGLDIYSGTLTRYYCRDWQTITQQLSVEAGNRCVMLDEKGNEITPEEDEKVIGEIRDAVCEWSDHIVKNIDPSLPIPLWNETGVSDYYTDKPDWMAFGALVLLQACNLLGCRLPEYIESSWNYVDDPIVKKAMSQAHNSSLLSDATMWLPMPDKLVFISFLPIGEESTISTVAMLKHELEEINQKVWKADEASILSWRNDKYYVPVEQKESRSFFDFLRSKKKTKQEKYRTEDLAQCAYSILYQAVKFADEQRLPVILDY